MSAACAVAGVRIVTQLCVSRSCTHTFRPAHPTTGSLSVVNSRIRRSYEVHFHRSRVAIASRYLSQSPYGSTIPNTHNLREWNEEREHTGDKSLIRYGRRRKFDVWKVKQKRFTRHITNLIQKGKASCWGFLIACTDLLTSVCISAFRSKKQKMYSKICSRLKFGRVQLSSTISLQATVELVMPGEHLSTSIT